MKNITISIDEHTHRQARIRAAELGMSVSALVRSYLQSLVTESVEQPVTNGQGSETPLERRCRLLKEAVESITADGGGLRMSENLPREALYDRKASR